MTFTKTVICPRCRHNIKVSVYGSLFQCSDCGQWFDYTELIPGYRDRGLPEDNRHDSITQWEDLEIAQLMGNTK
jgi:uncharacterized protein YbaR (Trm112 family)